MKVILFCNLPYAFSILKPLADQVTLKDGQYLWYVPAELKNLFPFDDYCTDRIVELEQFTADIIFVPGNDCPYWVNGLKVQIFHGLAGEKKGHFRIRTYFDLYLTPGPYFTKRFNMLSEKHKDFDVIETGWCKLDRIFKISDSAKNRKDSLVQEYGCEKIILYAPTFSPSLTSAEELFNTIKNIAAIDGVLVVIKFHDKMEEQLAKRYQDISNLRIHTVNDDDITECLQMSDIMISDTSSVVYEFALLDKPVITLNSKSENIHWEDCNSAKELFIRTQKILDGEDRFKQQRSNIIDLYHPYKDGKSAERMLDASVKYLNKHTIPSVRKISFLRRWKMNRKYRK